VSAPELVDRGDEFVDAEERITAVVLVSSANHRPIN